MLEIQKGAKERVPDRGFTHGGKFHADDVFATALLQILNPDFLVERGFDVPASFQGIVYDIGRGAFDHHQADKEIRDNGVPYAAFGLVWREYGTLILTADEAAVFDEHFIQPLDESDNTGTNWMLADIVGRFNPGWDEEQDFDDGFRRAVAFAKEILENEFRAIQGIRRARGIVERAMEENDGELLILPCYVPWKTQAIGSSYQFAIYPSRRGGFSVQGVPVSGENPALVCDFPREWWGREAEELKRLSGVATFRFCHATGFLAVTDTLEDAVALARIALGRRT